MSSFGQKKLLMKTIGCIPTQKFVSDSVLVRDIFHCVRKNKTSIFVSHRLSSATTADKIVVIDGGIVRECGSHSELMAKGGVYYNLFSTQAKRYIESEIKE